MAYVVLVGLVIAILAGISYAIASKKSNSEFELTWKKCILTGLAVYGISLFLGSLLTAVAQNSSRGDIVEFLTRTIGQTLGILLYALFFSFFLVLPVLILGLKFLSKTSLTITQKRFSYVAISFVLVLIMNALMTGFFQSIDFMLFLSGFSFFWSSCFMVFCSQGF
jgi:hypothetical protein